MSARIQVVRHVALFALLVAFTATASAEESSDSGKKPLLPFAPSGTPAVRPWHKYGEFYAGIGFGGTKYSDHLAANDDGSLTNINAKSSGLNWQLRVGFVGKYVGAEIGRLSLGRTKFTATSDGTGDSWMSGEVGDEVKASGWTYSALGRVPINGRCAALARVGMLSWNSTETYSESPIPGYSYGTESKDSGSGLLWGLGLDYDLYNQHYFWLRTEFMHSQVDDDELPVNAVTASLDFHFESPGGGAAARTRDVRTSPRGEFLTISRPAVRASSVERLDRAPRGRHCRHNDAGAGGAVLPRDDGAAERRREVGARRVRGQLEPG